MENPIYEGLCNSIEARALKVAAKVPANETPQLELLYRDIRIQMNELNDLRPYKQAVEEVYALLDQHRSRKGFNGFSTSIELLNKIDLILREIKN